MMTIRACWENIKVGDQVGITKSGRIVVIAIDPPETATQRYPLVWPIGDVSDKETVIYCVFHIALEKER